MSELIVILQGLAFCVVGLAAIYGAAGFFMLIENVFSGVAEWLRGRKGQH
ncbi:hypothetical protein [Stenotrophomonas sp.]|nr:hypothetical protein [Stenotrophomonas sp.]